MYLQTAYRTKLNMHEEDRPVYYVGEIDMIDRTRNNKRIRTEGHPRARANEM